MKLNEILQPEAPITWKGLHEIIMDLVRDELGVTVKFASVSSTRNRIQVNFDVNNQVFAFFDIMGDFDMHLSDDITPGDSAKITKVRLGQQPRPMPDPGLMDNSAEWKDWEARCKVEEWDMQIVVRFTDRKSIQNLIKEIVKVAKPAIAHSL